MMYKNLDMKWHPIVNGDLSGIQQQETLLLTLFDERQNENYVTTGWILENEGELQVRGVDPCGLNSNETKKVKAWMELPERNKSEEYRKIQKRVNRNYQDGR